MKYRFYEDSRSPLTLTSPAPLALAEENTGFWEQISQQCYRLYMRTWERQSTVMGKKNHRGNSSWWTTPIRFFFFFLWQLISRHMPLTHDNPQATTTHALTRSIEVLYDGSSWQMSHQKYFNKFYELLCVWNVSDSGNGDQWPWYMVWAFSYSVDSMVGLRVHVGIVEQNGMSLVQCHPEILHSWLWAH